MPIQNQLPFSVRKSLLSLVLVGALAPMPFAQAVPWSQSPPGGLAPENVPMFVCFGFDDNGYADGMNWFTKYVRGLKNPAGKGSAGSFDNAPVRATFFLSGFYTDPEGFLEVGNQTLADVTDSWKAAYADGHEIANHSWSHPHGVGFSAAQWKDQMLKSNAHIASVIGMDVKKIIGFRTPFLEYSPATFEAIKEVGFKYDCSIEFGFDGWQPVAPDTGNWNGMTNPNTHKKLYWPHTLDNGSPPGNASKGNPKVPGLWEVAVYSYLRNETNVVTGFDFNLWKVSNKQQFLESLKRNFDLRRAGNRVPLTINAHTDYYSQFDAEADKEFPLATYKERQEAIEEFITYVLQFPETRVVSYEDMLKWMEKPVGLGVTSGVGGKAQPSRANLGSLRLSALGIAEFSAPSRGEYTLSVRDLKGKTLATRRELVEAGPARIRLERAFTAGSYQVQIRNGSSSSLQQVVVAP